VDKQDLEGPVEGGIHLARKNFRTSSRRYSKEAGCPDHGERRRMPCGGIKATESTLEKCPKPLVSSYFPL
jgi:hypothetical protein